MCPVFMNLLREEKTEFAKVDRPSKLLRHSAFFSGVGYGMDKIVGLHEHEAGRRNG